MLAGSRSSLARLRFALKPASWPKLLVPCALGQAIGIFEAGGVCGAALIVGVAFTVAELVFIVFMNDVFDERVDGLKRAMFPSSSAKTLSDGVLPRAFLVRWGSVAAGAAFAVAGAGEQLLGRRGLLAFGVACLALFAAYSMPPTRLNYRGGGELLEAVGIGVALPWFNAFAQSGRLVFPSMSLLGPAFALALSSALASGLSDEVSDRAGGKETFTTQFGNRRVRAAVLACLLGAGLGLVASAWALRGTLPVMVPLVPAILIFVCLPPVRAAGDLAVTNAFAAQRIYKNRLHQALWVASALEALLLVAASCGR